MRCLRTDTTLDCSRVASGLAVTIVASTHWDVKSPPSLTRPSPQRGRYPEYHGGLHPEGLSHLHLTRAKVWVCMSICVLWVCVCVLWVCVLQVEIKCRGSIHKRTYTLSCFLIPFYTPLFLQLATTVTIHVPPPLISPSSSLLPLIPFPSPSCSLLFSLPSAFSPFLPLPFSSFLPLSSLFLFLPSSFSLLSPLYLLSTAPSPPPHSQAYQMNHHGPSLAYNYQLHTPSNIQQQQARPDPRAQPPPIPVSSF